MALQTQHSNTNSLLEVPGDRESLEIPVRLDTKRTKVRQRANSKVYGNGSSQAVSSSHTSSTTTSNGNGSPAKPANDTTQSSLGPLINERNKFVHILVLTSLNGTFERKTLEIPFFPDILKLGRPNSSQKAPDPHNGYFDSRVISREHARLTVKDGKIYIDDLNSANGTFLNGIKILKEHELKKNDTVELGVNIDNDNGKHHNHRRICCQATDILTLPLTSDMDKSKIFENLASLGPNGDLKDEKHVDLNAFDAAMFGDVTEELDDVALGISHDFLSGIFVNNNIGTNDNLVNAIRSLINQVHLERVNNLKLASVEKVLNDFRDHLLASNDVLNYHKYKRENEKLRKNIDDLYKEQAILEHTNIENLKSINKSNGEVMLKNEELNRLKELLIEEQETNLELTRKVNEITTQIELRDIEIERLQKKSLETNNELQNQINGLQDQLDEKNAIISELEAKKAKELVETSKKELLDDIVQLVLIVVGVTGTGLGLLHWFQ